MSGTPERPMVVDWARAGRRLRTSALAVGSVVVAGILVTWIAVGSPHPGPWIFLGVAVMFVVEIVVVGGSALRGMLRAGHRGDRLARRDVSLLPASRRRVARGNDAEQP